MQQALEINPLVHYTGTNYAACLWDAALAPDDALPRSQLDAVLCSPGATEVTVRVHLGYGQPTVPVMVSHQYVLTVGDVLRAIHNVLMMPLQHQRAGALPPAKLRRVVNYAHGGEPRLLHLLEGANRFMGLCRDESVAAELTLDAYFAL